MGQGFDVSCDNFIGHYIVVEFYLLNPRYSKWVDCLNTTQVDFGCRMGSVAFSGVNKDLSWATSVAHHCLPLLSVQLISRQSV